jgi:hypothetical protein
VKFVFRKRQAGVTLIEFLIAMGIGAALLFAVSSVLWNGTQATKSLTSKSEFNDMVANIQTRMNSSGLCKAMFANQSGIGKTNVPPLDTLGTPGGTTVPVPVAFDFGNIDDAHKGASSVLTGGVKLGTDFTILTFEFTGKTPSNLDSNGKIVGTQYEVPLHIVASRRIGGFAVSTSTDTSSGTAVTTTTLTKNKGSQTAIGGDTLEKTIVLHLTLDAGGKTVTGCSGQTNQFWTSDPRVFDVVVAGVHTPTIYKNNLQFLGAKNKVDPYAVGICNPNLAPYPAAMGCPNTPSNCDATNNCFPNHKLFLLDVLGQVWSDSHSDPSDARLKTNIREIPNAAARVAEMHGVEFDGKGSQDAAGGKDQLGLIAQEVEKQFPETVLSPPGNGMKSVAYENLLAPMVEAIKARQKILERQARDITELRQALSGKN